MSSLQIITFIILYLAVRQVSSPLYYIKPIYNLAYIHKPAWLLWVWAQK